MSDLKDTKVKYSILILIFVFSYIGYIFVHDLLYDVKIGSNYPSNNSDKNTSFTSINSIRSCNINWTIMVHLHFRKCAGTSIRSWIDTTLGLPISYKYSYNTGNISLNVINSIKKGYYVWHEESVPFMLNQYMIHNEYYNNSIYFMILRDPIERIFADITNMKAGKIFSCRGFIRQLNNTQKRIPKYYNNALMKCIDFHKGTYINLYTKTLTGITVKDKNDYMVTKTHLDIAKVVLKDAIDIIIIFEKQQESMQQFKCYGINNITIPHHNKRNDKDKNTILTDELKQYIINSNKV